MLEGAIVGAGRSVGELFRDKTDGDVACLGDVSCVLVGEGTEGCDVPLGLLGVEGRTGGSSWPIVESSSAWVSPKLFVSLRDKSTALCRTGKLVCPGLQSSRAF